MEDFIGIILEEAKILASSKGLMIRIVKQDSGCTVLEKNFDFNIHRVNLEIDNNVVITAGIG